MQRGERQIVDGGAGGMARHRMLTRAQWRVVALASGGGLVDGFDLIMLGSAIILLRPQFGLSPLQIGLLIASAYAGAFFGALGAGYYTDLRGRRAAFVASLGCLAAASLLSGLAPGFWWLIAARFVVGIGIGVDLPTSGAMIAEFVPDRVRGAALACWQLAWTFGALLGPVVAVCLLALGPGAWRWMLASGAVPALAILAARSAIPETPLWLQTQGRAQEAARVRAWSGLAEAADAGPPQSSADAAHGTQWQRTTAMLRGPHRRNLLIVSALSICGSVASLFLSSYSSFLARFYGATSVRGAILFGMVIWTAYLLGNITNILITDRVGRRPLLIGGGVATVAALVLAAWVGLDAAHVQIIFAIFALGAFCFWGGVNQAIWQYSAELFPTQIRGSARGFATSWTRFAAAVTAIATPPMLATFGFTVSMLVFALFAVGLVVCGVMLPETRGTVLDAAQPAAARQAA